ncbi:uncharacterized protein LOC117625546 [Prunus dulcis]|uniref:uncharacterized protein LOC117625546 n=1 Tax=Prunus dulcis TaxID=3755 RepID=UPI001482CC23|nr:uncharacterized protein LOC117625546 [Prunus dulcis]
MALLDEETKATTVCDVAGVLGLLQEQKLMTIIRMLVYGSFADQVDENARMGKSTTLESLVRSCDAVETLKGLKSIILEVVAGFDTWIWHAFFRVAGSQNDLNVLGQSLVFNHVLRGEAPNITYEINNTVYQNWYYLADGIYPRWTTFVKSVLHSRSEKQKLFTAYQEGYIKDVETCFGIRQAR